MAKRPRITIDTDVETAVAIKLAAIRAGDISVSELCVPIIVKELQKRFPDVFRDAERYSEVRARRDSSE